MSRGKLERLDLARTRLAEVETVEDATHLVDDLAQLVELGRIIGAAPGEINQVTLTKVEARAKRADLIDEGQANGTIARRGNQPKARPTGALAVPSQRLAEDRVLRSGLDAIRDLIAARTDAGREIVEAELIQAARRKRAQQTDREARFVDAPDDVDSDDPAARDEHGDGWRMMLGDFRDRLDELPDGSVDMIVTDPPYPEEFMPLWSDLAEQAARVLVPQGVLVALSGKINLPRVIAALDDHLAYGWIYCQPLPGESTRILGRHVAQEWKPWLAYSNGDWPSGRVDWHGDMLAGVSNPKGRYRWEQSEQPAGELIVRLSPDNGVVLDPFTGAGTYGVATRKAGRRFVGVEADTDRHAMASKRLAEQ